MVSVLMVPFHCTLQEVEADEAARWDEVDDHHDDAEEHEEAGVKQPLSHPCIFVLFLSSASITVGSTRIPAGGEEANEEPQAAPPPRPVATEPERQLSKKELKKKEMEDLDAVLSELGLSPAEQAAADEKSAKKKKKKEKRKEAEVVRISSSCIPFCDMLLTID